VCQPSLKHIKQYAIAIFVLVLVWASIWSYMSYRGAQDKLEALKGVVEGEQVPARESNDIVEKVRALVVVPEDEDPVIATVQDADKLAQEQPFYKNVQNGDTVLIYPRAQKAIIYRASEDILVNVGPVQAAKERSSSEDSAQEDVTDAVLDESESTETEGNEEQEEAEESLEPVSIEVRNGTGESGLAGKAANQLTRDEKLTVKTVGNADGSYDETIIVDTTNGSASEALDAVQSIISGSVVAELPDDERETAAEILVIIGKN